MLQEIVEENRIALCNFSIISYVINLLVDPKMFHVIGNFSLGYCLLLWKKLPLFVLRVAFK